MPYENGVALILVILVLLAPALRWAKDRWMSGDFHLKVDTAAGEKKISGGTLDALVGNLAGMLKCTSDFALETLRLDPTIRSQLEGQGAWKVLVKFLNVSADSFAMTAARKGNWSAVKALLSQCKGTVQREIAEIICGTQSGDEVSEKLLFEVIDSLVGLARLDGSLWVALLERVQRSGHPRLVAGTRTKLAMHILGLRKSRGPVKTGP